MLISAAFWLYLWGPVGLILSAPFAVCLVVIGKNVEQLRFLYLLLGDKPALSAEHSFYQRLMLGDAHEAARLALKRMKNLEPEALYDDLFLPTLVYTNRDVQRGFLDEEEQQSINDTMRLCLQQIKSPSPAALEAAAADAIPAVVEPTTKARLLACPGSNDSDLMALEMLKELLDPVRWDVQISSLETLSSELIAEVTQSPPTFIYIASTPPGGMGHAKYLCKRLRAAANDVPIMVGRYGKKRNMVHDRQQLELAGANFVVKSLLESRNLLVARLPLVTANQGVDLTRPITVADESGPSLASPVLRTGVL